MKSATRIMSEFEKAGHPLGRGIDRDQVSELVSRLRQRLGMHQSELDLSPGSLRNLEEHLLSLPRNKQPAALPEDDVVQFVREVAAYVGEVLWKHVGGRWESSSTLWGTSFVLEGGITVFKEGRRRIVPSIEFRLGNIGSSALDLASRGKKPGLYQDYLSAKRKVVKEQLR